MYRIQYVKSAQKELLKLQKNIRIQIIKKIEKLCKNPMPNGSIKLRGSDDYYRIRHCDYRVIYQIENDILVVLIIAVDHRREVYRDF